MIANHIASQVAIRERQLEICHFLLQEGADPGADDPGSFSPIEQLLYSTYNTNSVFDDQIARKIIGILQLMLAKINIDDFFGESGITSFWGNRQVFSFILKQSNFSYEAQSVEGCLEAIYKMLFFRPFEVAFMARIILAGKTLGPEIVNASHISYGTLLHCAAYSLGGLHAEILSLENFNQRQRSTRALRKWRYLRPDLPPCPILPERSCIKTNCHFVNDLLASGSNENALNSSNLRTPLLEFLRGAFDGFWFERKRVGSVLKVIMELLTTWLELLQNCGVDLVKYGRKEKNLHRANQTSPEFPTMRISPNLRLINFTYGAQPKDWKFWFIEVLEDWFSEFWDMVDHPERSMPGAWHCYSTLCDE